MEVVENKRKVDIAVQKTGKVQKTTQNINKRGNELSANTLQILLMAKTEDAEPVGCKYQHIVTKTLTKTPTSNQEISDSEKNVQTTNTWNTLTKKTRNMIKKANSRPDPKFMFTALWA